MAATGFSFANPKPSPDDFDTFNPQDVLADSKIQATPVTEAIPAPLQSPPVMSLDQVLGAAAVRQIQASGSIVFHSVGDTGGIKEPSHQFAVADAMAADLDGKTYASGYPAFFFHLGDVVYYFGQDQYYYDQFYDPYRNYNAPIFAIPGNHDGIIFPKEPVKFSLAPFCEHFRTPAPVHHPVAKGFARTTMTQPGVYFTLNAPFLKIIGLYSNTSETVGVLSGGAAGTDQLTFLEGQLTAAATARAAGQKFAIVIAVHHPPFTGSSEHFPSPGMTAAIDTACDAAGIQPDAVLSGHAHMYERYTRVRKGQQIPYVVAGNGGYFNLPGFKTGKGGAPAKPNVTGTDGKGNPLTLNAFNDAQFGFLRLTVTASSLTCEALTVDESSGLTAVDDHFKLDLNAHALA